MTQEIVYTSAPQGLRAGTRGFCTVASTAGMARNLADKLESMSGYRHAYPPHSAESHLNPVNYSHLQIRVGGRRYHVLSRIADLGFDYSKRSNKIAHHVALEESERVPAGPASVMAAPGFCETDWEGPPRILPAGRQPRRLSSSVGICSHWKTLTSDAGWAGVVAEHLLTKPKEPISLIFPPGTDTLALTVEVLSLLPEEQRWNIGFSTYFTKLPPGFECQFRFILDGTPEATALRRHPHAAVVDLCTRLGRATGGALVEVARTGRQQAPSAPAAEHSSAPAETHQVPVIPTDEEIADPQSPARTSSGQNEPLTEAGTYRLHENPARPRTAPRFFPRQPHPNGDRSGSPTQPRIALWAGLIACGILLFVGLAGGLAYSFLWPKSADEPVKSRKSTQVAAATAVISGVTKTADPVGGREGDGKAEAGGDTSKGIDNQGNSEAGSTESGDDTGTDDGANPDRRRGDSDAKSASSPRKTRSDKKSNPASPAIQPEPAQSSDLFSDIKSRRNRLNLPLLQSELNRPQTVVDDAGNLAQLHLRASQQLELEILGSKCLLENGAEFQARPISNGSSWEITKSGAGALNSDATPVGTFSLRDNTLHFSWSEDRSIGSTPSNDVLFRYAVLKLSVGTESVICTLTAPESVVAAEIGRSAGEAGSSFNALLPVPEALKGGNASSHLRIEIRNAEFAGNEDLPPQTYSGSGLRISDPRRNRLACSELMQHFHDGDSSWKLKNVAFIQQPMKVIWNRKELIPQVSLACCLRRDEDMGLYLDGRLIAHAATVGVDSGSKSGVSFGRHATCWNDEFLDEYLNVSRADDFLSNAFKDGVPSGKLTKLRQSEKAEKDPQRKAALMSDIREVEKEHKRATQVAESCRSQREFFNNMISAIRNGRIHYRLYLDLGEHEVDVLTSK